MSNCSSASVVVGPMEQTRQRRNPARAASSIPASRATRARCSICTAVVNSATSGLAVRQAAGGFTQRSGVLGKPVLVDANRRHLGAAAAQPGSQFRIAAAIFLNRDAPLGPAFGNGQDFPPRIRLGRGERGVEAHFPQRGDGFRAARHQGDLAKGIREGVFGITGGEHPVQLARADAGHQDHHVEPAGKQALGEFERRAVFSQRDLAHRWRHERPAPLLADKLPDLGRAPALKSQHAEAVECHIRL